MKLILRGALCIGAMCGSASAALFADSFHSTVSLLAHTFCQRCGLRRQTDLLALQANGLTLTGIYDSTTGSTNFTAQMKGNGVSLGWLGIGTGTKMAGSSMMIGWVNTDNTVVMSQRSAAGENDPTVEPLLLPKFTAHKPASTSTANGTSFNWVQPGFPKAGANLAQTKMIFGLRPGASPDTLNASAPVRKHSKYGYISLDLTKPYMQGSTVSGSVSQNSDEDLRVLDRRNTLVIAHMALAIVAWFVLMPLGIFLARFGRARFTWFPKHRAVQAAAVGLAVVSMLLGFGANWSVGSANLIDTHHLLGLGLVCLALFQAVLGQAGHVIRRAKGVRLQNYFHMVIGILLIPLAVLNAGKGFDLWEWAPPKAASIVVSRAVLMKR